MPPISASIEVARSAEQVFAYATDPSRFSEWQKASLVVVWTAPAQLVLGTVV